MFEKSKPVPHAFCGDDSDLDRMIEHAQERVERGVDGARAGDALRAIEWSELTARLNAARELRRELRQEAILCAGASGATFGDAAASYFRTLGDGERPVNPEALEGCKASCGNPSEHSGVAVSGDARDEL